MRWLTRILAGLAALIVIAFAGLYLWSSGAEGVWSYDTSIIINQPPEEVFPWLTEPDKLIRWVEHLQERRPLNGDSLRVGARSREMVNSHGELLEMISEIHDLEINRLLQIHISCNLFEHDARYELTAVPEGTRLRFTGASLFKPFLFRLLTPLLTPFAKQQYENNFRTLKALVEGAEPVTEE